MNGGYVISGTDLGHVGGDCTPGVNTDGTYNFQFIEDFIRIAIKQQILFSKLVAAEYYGLQPVYNYWNGCSTGGRQGYLLAQELGDQLDGILAAAPAIYWTRFQTAQMRGEIVMKQMVGGPIALAKLTQVQASAILACDANDGVKDGIIDDPRTCTFKAEANICGAPTAPAQNCLTAAEAAAVDKIWDGPRNAKGDKGQWSKSYSCGELPREPALRVKCEQEHDLCISLRGFPPASSPGRRACPRPFDRMDMRN